jgi:hypothetical protein
LGVRHPIWEGEKERDRGTTKKQQEEEKGKTQLPPSVKWNFVFCLSIIIKNKIK